MKGRALFCLHYHSISSDSEHKMEGELLKFLQQIKDDGGSASLTLTTRGGKVKAKLEVELEPPAPAYPGSTSPSPTLQGLLCTRQPMLLPPDLFLHQEMPLLHCTALQFARFTVSAV